MFDSVAPPAKGSNAMVASVNAAIPPVVTAGDIGSIKAAVKKPGTGPSASHSLSVSGASKTPGDRSAASIKPANSQYAPLPGKHQGGSGACEHVLITKAGLIPLPSTGAPIVSGVVSSSSHISSSGYIGSGNGSGASTTLTSSSKPVVAPASVGTHNISVARRLFTHHQQQPGSAGTSVGSGGGAGNATSLLGPQPSSYLSHPPSSTLAIHQATLAKAASTHSVKSTPHPGVGPVGSSKQQQKPKHPDSHIPVLPAAKDKVPMQQTLPKGPTTKMHYSTIINTGTTSADIQSAPPMGGVSGVDLIEQPMHQIMNTPMLFQDQITKTKKKSTYSDAVGKKNDGLSVQPGKTANISMHSGLGTSAIGSLPPLQQQQQQQQQQPKLNLAPGFRPIVPSAPGDKVRYRIPAELVY